MKGVIKLRDNKNKVKIMIECALMIAIGTILSNIKVYSLPNGGSITAAGALPFIIVSYRHGCKWGILTGIVNSILQILLGGLYAPPGGGILLFTGMVMLDYVLAYTVLGIAQLFAKPFKNRLYGIIAGSLITGILRFLCSFISGIVIWGSVSDGLPAVIFSLQYNASYMLPDTLITTIAAAIMFKAVPKIFNNQNLQ